MACREDPKTLISIC